MTNEIFQQKIKVSLIDEVNEDILPELIDEEKENLKKTIEILNKRCKAAEEYSHYMYELNEQLQIQNNLLKLQNSNFSKLYNNNKIPEDGFYKYREYLGGSCELYMWIIEYKNGIINSLFRGHYKNNEPKEMFAKKFINDKFVKCNIKHEEFKYIKDMSKNLSKDDLDVNTLLMIKEF